ncbi:MAG: alpha/beta hydrolase family protein [Candidatus Aminicenantales bacterium]
MAKERRAFSGYSSLKVSMVIVFSLGAFCLGEPGFIKGGQAEKLRPSEEVQLYKKGIGPFEVKTLLADWLDARRSRQVPVKIYYPARSASPVPLIILSHGLGGSREGYRYLGESWASHGYISLHVQHPGSDELVWKGQPQPLEAMRKAAANPGNVINRAQDVSFVIDRMEELNSKEGELKGLVDLRRIGIAGHSFGANTALVAAGQVFILPGGREVEFSDPRIKAALAMSAPVPRDKSRLERVFGRIVVPCFHMTGTLDDSPIGDTSAAERRLPFDYISEADQYLVIFNGGDHMIFSGRPLGATFGRSNKDALFQKIIVQASLAFWDAYLKEDGAARKWLAEGGFQSLLGPAGSFEKKLRS